MHRNRTALTIGLALTVFGLALPWANAIIFRPSGYQLIRMSWANVSNEPLYGIVSVMGLLGLAIVALGILITKGGWRVYALPVGGALILTWPVYFLLSGLFSGGLGFLSIGVFVYFVGGVIVLAATLGDALPEGSAGARVHARLAAAAGAALSSLRGEDGGKSEPTGTGRDETPHVTSAGERTSAQSPEPDETRRTTGNGQPSRSTAVTVAVVVLLGLAAYLLARADASMPGIFGGEGDSPFAGIEQSGGEGDIQPNDDSPTSPVEPVLSWEDQYAAASEGRETEELFTQHIQEETQLSQRFEEPELVSEGWDICRELNSIRPEDQHEFLSHASFRVTNLFGPDSSRDEGEDVLTLYRAAIFAFCPEWKGAFAEEFAGPRALTEGERSSKFVRNAPSNIGDGLTAAEQLELGRDACADLERVDPSTWVEANQAKTNWVPTVRPDDVGIEDNFAYERMYEAAADYLCPEYEDLFD